MSNNISIFAKEAFLNINPSEPFRLRTKPLKEGTGHMMRVSSLIRGDQIAERIGAKYNPTEGYEDDVCIYVKPMVRKDEDFEFKGKKIYLDIIDGHNLGQLAEKHPEVTVITCSVADCNTMKSVIKNEVIMIPQHHCNFDNDLRTRKGIKTVGIIGTQGAFAFIPQEIRDGLKERGIELLEYSRFFTRQDIVNFYKKIDLQLVWRPYKKLLSNPLKIVNASSFGVPTIALDEVAFHEFIGKYMPVDNVEEFFLALDMLLKDKRAYDFFAMASFTKAQEYHIDKIAEMYKKL